MRKIFMFDNTINVSELTLLEVGHAKTTHTDRLPKGILARIHGRRY